MIWRARSLDEGIQMEGWPKSGKSPVTPSLDRKDDGFERMLGIWKFRVFLPDGLYFFWKLEKRSRPETEEEQDWIDFIKVVNIWRSKWRTGENWLQTWKRSLIQPWNKALTIYADRMFSHSSFLSPPLRFTPSIICHCALHFKFLSSVASFLLFSVSHHFPCSNS